MKKLFIFAMILLTAITCTQQKHELDIGLIGIYSGRYSEVGVSSRNGAALAIEQINQKGGLLGRKVTFTPIDVKNDKNLTMRAFEQHIAAGRNFIIGPNISHLSEETRMYAMKDNLLIISPTMSTDKMLGLDDNFFRVISVTSQEGKKLAEIAKNKGLTRAAVIYDISNAEYTEPIYSSFRQEFEKNSSAKIVYVNHVSNDIDEDFLDMAESITATSADMVLILTTAIDAASIAQQIRKIKSKIKLFAARWAKTLDIISNGGQAVEGMVLSSMYTPEDRTEAYNNFTKAYKEKYNTDPSFISAYAYEAVMVLAESIKKANSFEVAKVRSALIEKKSFNGLEEEFTIDKFGDATRKSSLVEIRNGVFEVIND